MITEDMLQAAAHEADKALQDSLFDLAKSEHIFSKRFERKIRKLIRRARHPVATVVFRRAVCVCQIVILIFGVWLLADAEARTAFLNWTHRQYESFYEYRANDSANKTDYSLSWLPDGYTLSYTRELSGNTVQVYEKEDGLRIYFSYSTEADSSSLFVESDYVLCQTVELGDVKADFYRAKTENVSNVLIWTSPDGSTLFSISAFLEQDQLVQIAKNIKVQE